MSQNKKTKAFIVEPEAVLDYHTYGIIDDYSIEKILREFLEDSYFIKCKFVEVITGKGKVVRPLVQKLLSKNKLVESFKPSGEYSTNQGSFEIVLKN